MKEKTEISCAREEASGIERINAVKLGMVLNVHYLKAVEEIDGRVVVSNYRIRRPVNAIAHLKAIRDDDTKTLADMCEFAGTVLAPSERNFSYSYVYPNDYDDRFCVDAVCPELIGARQYWEMVNKLEEALHAEWAEAVENARAQGRKFTCSEGDYVRDNKQCRLQKKKDCFFDDFRTYVSAKYYLAARKELMTRPGVKMCSTDRHGWPDMNKRFQAFEINEDVKVSVFTNFAYGHSTYFFLGLTYKGIDILPYSFLVKYYYVKDLDVIRYTRNYANERDSWKRALKFVADIANLAKSDPEGFVREWVRGEVDKMVNGLRCIAKAPRAEMERIVKSFKIYDKEVKKEYISVRNIDTMTHSMLADDAIKAVMPDELAVVWKAEKMVAVLNCLTSVAKLAPIYPDVVNRISEVRRMSAASVPEFNGLVSKINREISERERVIDAIRRRVAAVERRMKPHQDEIQRRKEAFIAANTVNGECRYEGWVLNNHLARINNNYELEHPEYSEMCRKREVRLKKIKEKLSEVRMRKALADSLVFCCERITGSTSFAAVA